MNNEILKGDNKITIIVPTLNLLIEFLTDQVTENTTLTNDTDLSHYQMTK